MAGFRFRASVLLAVAGCSLATVTGPVINQDFPDPGIMSYNSVWYAFATNGNGYNIQVAQSTNGGTSWTVLAQDALPNVGSWATTGNTWAPAPISLGANSFVLYYTATDPSTGSHCVGAATSTTPTGPYTPQSSPIQCQAAGGGAIDPSPFRDTNGQLYIVFKVDGNNLGGGGSCGNGNLAYATPIMLQAMESNGVTPSGNPITLLNRSAADGPLIEAPGLVHIDGTYFLFFSSNCYNTNLYDTSYATATSVTGPYTKAQAPIAPFLQTGQYGLTSPGSASVLPDGSLIAFHATTSSNPLIRPMYISRPTWTSSSVAP
ncbi:hypothetical protein FRB96_000687 [Tulasnella sp. 330]|nr:hypothetical protein FRB96_000687 [Tulasnella sp. 330]